ncbi:MAG: NfeD family protein [Atribacterota bacterium]|nr:NfeD family protein [Atribacterota bacterium]
MFKRNYTVFIIVLLILICFFSLNVSSSSVYVIPVKGQIEPGWLLFLERSLEDAQQNSVMAIILDIDTPGGFVDTAQKAKILLDEFPAPIYGFINTNALSAGAYLSLITDSFYMTPGSSIGAAEPAFLGGGQINEKILSFWEAEMRSVAERQGKDPDIAAAMVRKEIAIEGLVEEGELLTLTTAEAEKIKFSNGTVSSILELLELKNISSGKIIYTSPTFWENLSGWIINPIIATLLLIFGFFFLIVEILSAGFGFSGFLSLLSFGLYFGGHFFMGISGWPAIFLFIFGIIFILVEAFMPGFGIFGIGGLVAVIIGIVLAAASTKMGIYMLLISFLTSIIAGYIVFKHFQRKGTLKNFILSNSATREAGYSSSKDYGYLLGKKGQTVTPLRPSGSVEIEGEKYDTVSDGAYISAGKDIEVIKVEGYRIVVRIIDKEE